MTASSFTDTAACSPADVASGPATGSEAGPAASMAARLSEGAPTGAASGSDSGPRLGRRTSRHQSRARRQQRRLPGTARSAWQVARGVGGQSTVEFAVVMAGFLSLTAALSVMWHAFDGGLFVEHALAVASHHIQSVAPVTVADLFLY